jgi:hypothetical protein
VVLADRKASDTDNLADLERAAAMLGARLERADVAAADGTPRHDPRLLAEAYAEIFAKFRGSEGYVPPARHGGGNLGAPGVEWPGEVAKQTWGERREWR